MSKKYWLLIASLTVAMFTIQADESKTEENTFVIEGQAALVPSEQKDLSIEENTFETKLESDSLLAANEEETDCHSYSPQEETSSENV